MKRLLVLAALLFVLPAHAEVTFDWVTVGDPGNAADIHDAGYGSVAYTYRISKYEVTNAQYAEFLNAVADADPNELYNTDMATPASPYFGGITTIDCPGGDPYCAIAGREDMPVNYVSFWDATRFVNWLHNGQPTGVQDSTTTEDGAYTLTPTGIANNTVTRNTSVATFFVPSQDEWYKAAYYDALSTSYFDYPAGSDTQTTCTVPGATANTANCSFVNSDLTDVGSYTGAASPSGTFDQGGNVSEWNDTIFGLLKRGGRGGGFRSNPDLLAASYGFGYFDAAAAGRSVGFRVASVPEPVKIDIKPGSCPNSWNRESNGVLPVAILGTEDFDVTEIDLSSVTISRGDGTGGSVAPNEGPPGPHSEVEDVATPLEGETCDCHELGADGEPDLSVKFRTEAAVLALELADLPSGDLVELIVSGTLLDGTPFEGSDCVRLVPPGSPPNQVTVQSIAGGWVDATPLDNQLDGGGFGSFKRTYPHTTWLTLNAPSGHDGNPFVGWKLDGGDLVQRREITFVVNNAEHTAKAVFKKANGCGLGFELAFLVPPLVWLHRRRKQRRSAG